jgi:predicted nucleic acid-binding protein
VPGTHIFIVGQAHYEEVSIVATTTNIDDMGKTAEAMARSAQQSAYTAMDYAVKAQEVNAELLQKTAEVWIEGVRKQTELSQDMAQEVFEKAEDQAYVYQDFYQEVYKRWNFPFGWMPYEPFAFAFGREWPQKAQGSVWDTQKTAAEETARAIKATAPDVGSFPIIGYDEKNVREITERLDTLIEEQLRRVKDYEQRHKNRETVLHEINRKIGAAS